MTVLQLTAKLILFIAVGFAARKLKVMADGFDTMLSKFLMAIPLPCMIVNSFHIEYSVDNLLNTPILLLMSVGSMAFLFLLITVTTGWMKNRDLRRTLRFSLLFTNFTFLGLPVVSELYGADGVFSYVIFTLPIRIMFYGGACIMLGKGGEKLSVRETIRKFICAPVVAVFLGFALYALRIELPAVLQSAISTLGSMASPLGLLLCGTIVADADWRGMLRQPVALIAAVLRLTVIPAIIVGVFLLLGIDHELIRNTMYFFAMPVASLTPTFLLQYNPEAVSARESAGYMVVASTVFCIVTIPGWTLILQKLL